jgi:hypothetical protein
MAIKSFGQDDDTNMQFKIELKIDKIRKPNAIPLRRLDKQVQSTIKHQRWLKRLGSAYPHDKSSFRRA